MLTPKSLELHQRLMAFGPCKRNWGDVKTIKTGKRSHTMSGESTEKRTILYATALVNEARIKRVEQEKLELDAEGPNAMFCDEDMQLVFAFSSSIILISFSSYI